MEEYGSLIPHPDAEIPTPLRRRRSSSGTIFPKKLSVLLSRDYSSETASSDDLELISLKSATAHCYTSLKDVISPASVVAWSTPASGCGGDIGIRNRLVKQAAWAYLQPMSSSPSTDESGGGVFRRLWQGFASVVDWVRRSFLRVVNWVFRIRGPI
ncbi:hypothetical protein M569_05157 [Genlisea aurea]|uniref:Uncharacterized protein n=1 Tax=Genlisea aurea TaxID=192259 RepID=S8CQX6_9LAMI|nr:hypothetical protein M569_05157 [Genlisea aurea]